LDGIRDRTRPLGELFETRQGMAENPPAINRRLAREFEGQYAAGEGVFVLRRDEIERLRLADDERALLRPYYDTSALKRYSLPDEPTHSVLYLTRDTAPAMERIPQIAGHLERFRPILDRRREVRAGKSAWWHLHWPRAESIFLRPRILSVQMGRRPQFVFADRPTFVGFSVNVILHSSDDARSLLALTGVLNSQLAGEWLARHAKRRGVNLEINAHVLRLFPLPPHNTNVEESLAARVRERQERSAAGDRADELEDEIQRLVERWYDSVSRRVTSPAESISSIP
jgi:adenine-specific DNA-methyltransferase